MRQRAKAIENLIEEVLRVDLLHDLAVDPFPHAQHPLPVHRLDGVGDQSRDPRQPTSIAFIIRASIRASAIAAHVRPRRRIGANSIVSATGGC